MKVIKTVRATVKVHRNYSPAILLFDRTVEQYDDIEAHALEALEVDANIAEKYASIAIEIAEALDIPYIENDMIIDIFNVLEDKNIIGDE